MIHELNSKAIAVEVPEKANSFEIHDFISETRPKLFQFKPNYYKFTPRESITLPPGNWEILGRPDDLTREQCDKIMEDYDEGTVHLLLISKNVPVDKVIILLKK